MKTSRASCYVNLDNAEYGRNVYYELSRKREFRWFVRIIKPRAENLFLVAAILFYTPKRLP
jgi:hypothetical protein